MTTMTFERETDEKLAALWTELGKAQQRLSMFAESALRQAGAKGRYVTRNRKEYDLTLEEAEAILAADVAAHAATADPASPNHDYGYTLIRGGGNIGSIRRTVAELAEVRSTIARLRTEIDTVEELYTGWSRFFLVTSSKGHIHRSMSCSTCRWTTTYGWLPNLSGRTEADCVDEFGPALCSVCYPTAPVEWTTEKLTKGKAEAASA